MSRRVKITNNYKNDLRIAVVFREIDLISSHNMRYSHITNSSNTNINANVGFGKNIAGCSTTKSNAFSSENKSEDTLQWKWNDFIIPGMVIVKPNTFQIYTVLNDKPIYYITVIDHINDVLIAEHFPTDATEIIIDKKGSIEVNVNINDEIIKLETEIKRLKQLLIDCGCF